MTRRKPGRSPKLRVCIAGATGWAGSALSVAVSKTKDLRLVGAVSRTHQDRNLGEVLQEPGLNLVIRGTVEEALQTPTDVLFDYTKPDIVKANVMTAIARGVHVVIGTSGLSDAELAEIDRAAKRNKVGAIAVGNFAISAVLLQRFACQAAQFLSHWEIIDYASASKPDAPSGMARELAFRLSEIKKPRVLYPVEKTSGLKETRGANLQGTQVHSLRLPSYTIALEIVFGEEDERLALRYDAGSGPAPYLPGALLALRSVKRQTGLVRGLERLLDLPPSPTTG
jgi:4-hydroxy-tetrahydrodipicolinate reductase